MRVDGVELHYRVFLPIKNEEKNQKDTIKTAQKGVLMIHGFSGSTYSWQKNVDSLTKKGLLVVLVDLPAFGFSDKSTTISHANSYKSKLLWKLLENIQNNQKNAVTKWHFVGHSMGAGTALAMAHQNPQQTDKIVLVGGAYSGKMQSGWFGYVLAYPPLVRWVEVLATNYAYNPAYFEKLLKGAYSQNPNEKDIQGYYSPFEQEKNITRAILAMARNSADSISMDFSALQDRITLIWGENDKWVPIKNAENFIKKYPKSTLKIIKNAGHCPMETHNNEFNGLLGKLFF